MAAMLFVLVVGLLFFVAAELALKFVPDESWDKLMHLLRFD